MTHSSDEIGRDGVSEWAMTRALAEMNADGQEPMARVTGWSHRMAIAFARYIEAHEEPPVDPLQEEAQRIADFNRINLSAMPRVEDALMRALRRGIELARSEGGSDVKG